MSATAERAPADALTGQRRASWRVDAVTMLLGTWLLVGVMVDGWAHNNLEALETFFTPWHALFYSGFVATACWVLATAARARQPGQSGLEAFPAGYGLAVVGVVVFAVGGAGDLTWHTVFGIEQDLEALFSPTHLLLFVGMTLILSTPLRAAWSDPAEPAAPGYRRFLPVLASAALVTALVAFAFLYWAAFIQTIGVVNYDDSLLLNEVASVQATNLILLAPVLLLARRWRPPFGTATTIYGSVGVLIGAVDAYRRPAIMAAAVLAGLAVDGLLRLLGPSAGRPRRFWATGAMVPLITWSVYFAAVSVTVGIGWSAELWTGTIAWACLLGLALSLLMLPPPVARMDSPEAQMDGGRQ
jgi:hypothetical protein